MIVTENSFVATAPFTSCAVAVNVKVPAVDGVPLIIPVAGFRESPGGGVPDHCDTAAQPLAANPCEYDNPTVPEGSGDGVDT